MTTFHLNNLPKEKRIQMIGEFYDTINSLKDRSEVRLFFKSLLSADEIATLMRRIEVAVLLSANYKYINIIGLLGVSRGKISNVHKSLLQDDSGYKIVVKRLIENRKNRLRKMNKLERDKMSPLANLKKNPRHALLANLIDAAIFKIQEDGKELERAAIFFTPSAGSPRNKK
ncbi:MAG: TrpR like protein, YerC/YecD [Parcubacteria group bacterium GW2011_GWA2_33_14]|nr:MAG: TrpR like protein, YerC/YecD [Parcubacteria group bacterium GW2011_GWA2_33_14]